MIINTLHVSEIVKATTTLIILDLIRISIDVGGYFCIVVLKG